MNVRVFVFAGFTAFVLSACGKDAPAPVLETVAQADIVLSVQAEGELKSAKSTPLMVPGQNWSSRRLIWMVPEGSLVKKGEVVKAFIVLKPGASLTADALIAWSRDNMATYKVPKYVEFIDVLPTTGAGKVLRRLLKAS